MVWEIRTQENPGDWTKSPPPQAKNIALCLAAANGHLTCIEPLLAMGADAGITCPFSQSEWFKWPGYYTPVQYAAENGHPAMVELLLAKGAVPGGLMGMTALEHSILNKLESCTYFLLDHGLSTRVEAPVVARTYLIEKASEGRQGMVRTLVENGVNIFANNSDDQAAVQYAVEHARVKCLRNLLEDQAVFGSEIVLHIAVMQMMRSRLEANATMGPVEDIALKFAAHFGDVETVQLLLINGVNVSTPDQDGFRPLHYAAGAALPRYNLRDKLVMSYDDREKSRNEMSDRQIKVIEMLLEKGACISDVDDDEYTALNYIIRLGYESTIKCLKQKTIEPQIGYDNFVLDLIR